MRNYVARTGFRYFSTCKETFMMLFPVCLFCFIAMRDMRIWTFALFISVLFLLDVRIPGEQSFWCEFFTRETAEHHGSILWFCFSLIIYSTNNDQNYFLCLLFIIFSGLISQWPQSSLDFAGYRAAFNRNSQSCASCATAWQSAVSFFLCSIPLAWNWFYSFLYLPSPVHWFIVIGIAPLLHVATVYFDY